MIHHARIALIATLLPLVAAVAHSQDDADPGAHVEPPPSEPAETLPESPVDPEAQRVLARAVDAIGGDSVRRSITSTRSVARLEITSGATRFELLTRRPDLFLVRHQIDGLGEMELGFDGVQGWRRDPPDGMLSYVDATTASAFARRFDLQALLRELDLRFTDARLGESVDIDGVECDVVLMRNGEQIVSAFFDRKSGLPMVVEVAEAEADTARRRVIVVAWSEAKTPLRWVREFRIEQPRDSLRAIYDSVTFDDVSESTFLAPPSLAVDAGGSED